MFLTGIKAHVSLATRPRLATTSSLLLLMLLMMSFSAPDISNVGLHLNGLLFAVVYHSAGGIDDVCPSIVLPWTACCHCIMISRRWESIDRCRLQASLLARRIMTMFRAIASSHAGPSFHAAISTIIDYSPC